MGQKGVGNVGYKFWSNYFATQNTSFPPQMVGLVREISLFQGKLGWWNSMIWPDTCYTLLQYRLEVCICDYQRSFFGKYISLEPKFVTLMDWVSFIFLDLCCLKFASAQTFGESSFISIHCNFSGKGVGPESSLVVVFLLITSSIPWNINGERTQKVEVWKMIFRFRGCNQSFWTSGYLLLITAWDLILVMWWEEGRWTHFDYWSSVVQLVVNQWFVLRWLRVFGLSSFLEIPWS